MRLRPLIAAAALFAAHPAAAGITAHYRLGMDGPEQRAMVIEVNDRGESRMDMGAGYSRLLLLDGIAYLVDADAQGSYVARLEDAFTVAMDAWDEADGRPPRDSAAPPSPRPPLRPPTRRPPQVELIRVGTEIVAGRSGTVWRIRDPAAPAPAREQEFVVSDDPALAPLSDLLGPRPVVPPDPAFDPNGALAARAAVYRKGAILREGRTLRLERVEIHPLPDAFVLPGPVLSREALVARRRRPGRH